MTRRRAVLSIAVALAAGSGLALGGAPAPAGATVPTTCLGKPVTVVAGPGVTVGTEGDDVVVTAPGWLEFDALGGNDTVCVSPAHAPEGYRSGDPLGDLRTGPGDDVVVPQDLPAGTPAPEFPGRVSAWLGAGNDRFTGRADATTETVYPDEESEYVGTPPPGAQRDVVDMGGRPDDDTLAADTVRTEAEPGGTNADVVVFGGGKARLYHGGVLAPEVRIDFSAASEAELRIEDPTPSGAAVAGPLLVDAPAGRATVDGVQVLAWSGTVRRWAFGWHGPTWRTPVSFLGTDAGEELAFFNDSALDLRLEGGDDAVLDGIGKGLQRLDTGTGRDRVRFSRPCPHLVVRLDDQLRCGRSSADLLGVEEVEVDNFAKKGRLTVVGSDGADRVEAYAARVRFDGGGGADEASLQGTTVRADGGAGADVIEVSARDTVVHGEGGADRLTLTYYRRNARQQVALGGPGRDQLVGSTSLGRRGDLLVGGPGRDRADGRKGGSDRCDAEVMTRCEGRAPRTTR